MDLEKLGIPTVTVVATPFQSLFQRAVAGRRFPKLAHFVVPHPFDTKPDDEVRKVAAERTSEVLGKLTSPLEPGEYK